MTRATQATRARLVIPLNALEAGDVVPSSVLSLISSTPAKKNYPLCIYSTTLSVVRQYTETSQQRKMETTKIVSSMQLCSQTNTYPDSPRQQLTMTGVARVEEIENGLSASKALNESRPRRLRHLMCFVLPIQADCLAKLQGEYKHHSYTPARCMAFYF